MKMKLWGILLLSVGALMGYSQSSEEIDLNEQVSNNPPDHAPMQRSGIVLYDNGSLVNSPGTGTGGADESTLQNSSLNMSTLGFGHQSSAGNRVADDFAVPAGGWQIDQIAFYAYQTGSTTASTITSVNLQIWDAPPGSGARVLIWGDTTTNVLNSSAWSGIYRVTETTSGSTNRPIMENIVDVGVFLNQGTYWLDWQVNGSLGSGPWAPPITIAGNTVTGNALQSISGGAFGALNDGGTGAAQGLPFLIISNEASSVPTMGQYGALALLMLIGVAGLFFLRKSRV